MDAVFKLIESSTGTKICVATHCYVSLTVFTSRLCSALPLACIILNATGRYKQGQERPGNSYVPRLLLLTDPL